MKSVRLKNNAEILREKFDLSKKYFSLEEDSPFAILSEDIKNLDKPRKLGISGQMRAKNEAQTIGEAIETALPALDELIITVQPSTDGTYEICQEKAKKYPDKIKLYYYTPEVIPVAFSHCFEKGKHNRVVVNHSIHNFAHYSNFGLVRISYKYHLKIDADQIYFTSKLMEFREALLAADKYHKPKRSFINKVLGKLHRPFCSFLAANLSMKTFMKYMTMITGRCAYGFCGLNLGQNPSGIPVVAGGGG